MKILWLGSILFFLGAGAPTPCPALSRSVAGERRSSTPEEPHVHARIAETPSPACDSLDRAAGRDCPGSGACAGRCAWQPPVPPIPGDSPKIAFLPAGYCYPPAGERRRPAVLPELFRPPKSLPSEFS